MYTATIHLHDGAITDTVSDPSDVQVRDDVVIVQSNEYGFVIVPLHNIDHVLVVPVREEG